MEDSTKERLMRLIAERDAARGRPLTWEEKLANLVHALGECDADCASRRGNYCDCGAREFRVSHSGGRRTR